MCWSSVKPDHRLALVRALRGDEEEYAVCRSGKGFSMSSASVLTEALLVLPGDKPAGGE